MKGRIDKTELSDMPKSYMVDEIHPLNVPGVDGAPQVRYFVMGSGQWKQAETWPAPGMENQDYYLSSAGTAGIDGSGVLQQNPSEQNRGDSYDYDPIDPVPTLWDKSLFTVPTNRRALEYRQDILYYKTEPLTEEVEVVGYPRVVLHAASSAPDTDFFARLVDDRFSGFWCQFRNDVPARFAACHPPGPRPPPSPFQLQRASTGTSVPGKSGRRDPSHVRHPEHQRLLPHKDLRFH